MSLTQSPARVRQAFPAAVDSAALLAALLRAEGAASQDGLKLCRRYTVHVAARTLFGLEANSLKVCMAQVQAQVHALHPLL